MEVLTTRLHLASSLRLCRHLPKIFENVHSLEFGKDERGIPTNTAMGMYSGGFAKSLEPVPIPKPLQQSVQ